MQDMNNPLPATKGTHISLLAGPHSQGGKIVVTANTGDANNGYEGTATTNLPISFPTSELLAVGTVRDVSGWNLKEIMTIGSLTKTQISVLMQCKISTEMVGFWVAFGY